jgi:hypothetical protein
LEKDPCSQHHVHSIKRKSGTEDDAGFSLQKKGSFLLLQKNLFTKAQSQVPFEIKSFPQIAIFQIGIASSSLSPSPLLSFFYMELL